MRLLFVLIASCIGLLIDKIESVLWNAEVDVAATG